LRKDEDEGQYERDGWETIRVSMDRQIVGIRTASIDEKCQAFDTLVIYCGVLGGCFGPYVTQSLELTLPALEFYFHEGVREAACRRVRFLSLTTFCVLIYGSHRLVPLLMSCGKSSGTLTPHMATASFSKLVYCIQHDTDPSFVASLYKAVGDTLCVVGGPGSLAFTPELTGGLIDGTKLHLQNMAEKRKRRAASAGVGAQGSGNGAGGSAHALTSSSRAEQQHTACT
jgi:hypothetical protein